MANSPLTDRLNFLQIDDKTKEAVKRLRPLVQKHMPVAMDQFYEHIWKFQDTSKFFKSREFAGIARSRQLTHWDTIVSGEFGQAYYEKVQAVGKTHARIGLEPRWYIGGYAVVLDHLIRAAVAEAQPKKGWFGGKSDATTGSDLADSLGSLCKTVLLDIELAISVYFEASEKARREAEEKQSEIRDEAIRRSQQEIVAAFGDAFDRLAQNDLTCRVEADVPPIFEAMKASLNATIERLADTIRNIKTATEAVNATSDQIRSGSNKLSSRSEAQAASLEETAATTEEMAASIKASAMSAKSASELANSARSGARSGGEITTKAVQAMGQIEQASKKISDITVVIDDIAFQTNLLALNAAVEAARAGDAGKGFAVVASEVRTLAQRSAQAARDIADLIKSSNEEILSGVDLVRRTGDALTQILTDSENVASTITTISTAIEEQARGIGEMSETVANLDSMTQQNAELAVSTSDAANNLSHQMEQLQELMEAFTIHQERKRAGVQAIGLRPGARRAA